MLSEYLAPTFIQMLTALSGWLDKARAEAADADRLLSARLAPDMFPLATQIRFACVQAREGVYRLRGEEFPRAVEALLDQGRAADSHPGTIADAQACIAETIALVESLGVADCDPDPDPDRPVAHALPNGMILDLTARQYGRDWALSQFYFHVMIAYAILRSQGIALGKADYIAHMLPYFRPETPPTE